MCERGEGMQSEELKVKFNMKWEIHTGKGGMYEDRAGGGMRIVCKGCGV